MMKINDKRHLYDAFISAQNSVGLYIHIPFCKKKCAYCDFLSSTCYEEVDQYFSYLMEEVKLYHNLYGPQELNSIYIGGGTPSSVGQGYISSLLKQIYKHNNVDPNSEITIEVNPESVSENKLKEYRDSGINRISMGCQSFNDEKLKTIGRIHKASHIYEAYDLIRKLSFSNVNLDIIFALPGQSFQEFDQDIDALLRLEPEHISAYSLILEEDTQLFKDVEDGKLDLLSDEKDRYDYHHLIKKLEEYGYHQYEISNFAKDGKESRHNLKYWTVKYYIGLGLGSSSFFDSKRYSNFDNFNDYYNSIKKASLAIKDFYEMDYDELKIDYILMNLRLTKGINLSEYKNIFARDFYLEYKGLIDDFIEGNYMVNTGENIAFTSLGFDISNRFFVEII